MIQNEYDIPEGYSLDELTAEIFSYLGNTDPELRDDIGYIVYANWLEKGYYSQAEVEVHIQSLLENLNVGIGETKTDTVFLRSFSALFLAEIIHNDNKDPNIEENQIQAILEKGLEYLQAEKDPRGYVQSIGWAHALAHTADLLRVLSKSEHTGLVEHKKILNGIAKKLIASSDWVYIHGEDDRLSATVLPILKRDMLPVKSIKEWAGSLTGSKWKGAWNEESPSRAFFNVRNFLRGLYLQITTEEELPRKEEKEQILLDAIQNLQPF
ncbi:MAG: DUF2785 domain-containing protein [Anaerolineales bacterium]